ncbi:MAG TPA: glycosyltransferase [Candidatus Fournierella merdipullorum]|uniref:Glycosyltransferase n=1 Tax=Candidatus Allofournierella merdipullorum TaxID=2838595 RepID=A0A9D2E3Z6_9FIRM|nr:glycosyltransferase [Candidatus Fournierella merdipullorum]
MAPKVTIVMPVYKVEQYLPSCIESVRAQTFTDWECILVDDGSPDGCGAICDEAARRDERFRVVHRENGGLSRARNSGMEVARGEYYVFLDSDDAIHPRLLELALKEQASHPQSLITWRFTSDPDLWDQPELDFSDYTTTSYPRQRLLAYFANRTLFNSADNKLYPRDFILEHDLWFDPEAAYHEDYVFFTAFWQAFFRRWPQGDIRQIDLPLYFYNRSNMTSITHTDLWSDPERDFSDYCADQLRQFGEMRDLFAPLDQHPAADLLPIMTAPLNSIAYGLCKVDHPHREICRLWRIPELREISQWHRRHRVHNAYLFFLRLRWAGGLRWWWNVISEKHSHIFYTVYHLGYRNILKP